MRTYWPTLASVWYVQPNAVANIYCSLDIQGSTLCLISYSGLLPLSYCHTKYIGACLIKFSSLSKGEVTRWCNLICWLARQVSSSLCIIYHIMLSFISLNGQLTFHSFLKTCHHMIRCRLISSLVKHLGLNLLLCFAIWST